MSQPISRVLSRTIIYLGHTSPHASCSLPGSTREQRASLDADPYLALLQVGFTLLPMLPPARCALTAPFHPYQTNKCLAVFSLLHLPWACAPQELPGTLLYGARTFLRCLRSRDCLADSDASLARCRPKKNGLY